MSDCLVAFVVRNNEETVKKMIDVITACPFSHVIPLIIDDGSSDDSASIVSDTDIHFVMHEEPLGYGGSLISALSYAKDYSLDSMFMLPVSAFIDWHTIINYLQHLQNADIISGNRITPADSLINEQYGAVVNFINQKTGLHIMDPFSPVKGVAMKHADCFEITEFSDAALAQIIIQAAHFKLTIKEFECAYPHKDLHNHIDDVLHLPGLAEFLSGELHLYPYTKGH